jgi:predicted membrane protein
MVYALSRRRASNSFSKMLKIAAWQRAKTATLKATASLVTGASDKEHMAMEIIALILFFWFLFYIIRNLPVVLLAVAIVYVLQQLNIIPGP